MIVKHIPMNSARKSDFIGLVMYITGPQGKHERVGDIRVSNCHSEQAEIATLEVLNTQAQNTRSAADKTYHLIISFRAGELPDQETLQAIEERICSGLGFADHQRVSVVHHDTDNLHVHIAINKIHPTRYTIHEPFNAYHTLAQLCDRLERDYGLQQDNHKASKSGGENRASDMERHAATESLLSWVRRECKSKMQGALSWDGLHHVMREHGLQLLQRGNGFVISSENGVCIKASSVAREFSKSALEGRLGRFEPNTEASTCAASKSYDKRPIRHGRETVELYARYTDEQKNSTSNRAAEWAKVIARKARLIEAAKRNGRIKRAAIKLVRAPRVAKKLMYAATSKKLREEIAAITRQYLRERQEIYEKYRRLTWADWLRREAMAGDLEALDALRARKPDARSTGNSVHGAGNHSASRMSGGHDSITKKGTVIYRCGASAIRDDGDRLNVSRGADRVGLEAALRMAIARYGSRITVNGSDDFKEKIVMAATAAHLTVSFNDDALERRHRLLANSLTTKENRHEYDNRTQGFRHRGRSGRVRDGSRRAAAASRAAAADQSNATQPAQHGDLYPHGGKPHSRRTEHEPAPEGHDRVRGLPEFGVVRLPDGGQVLLPGDVPGDVEHAGSQPAHSLRRHVHRTGGLGSATQDKAARSQEKPNVGRAGTAPPPASKDRLRRLSQLGTMVIDDRSAAAATSGGKRAPPGSAPVAPPTIRHAKRNHPNIPPPVAMRGWCAPIAPMPSTPARGTQITPSPPGNDLSTNPKRLEVGKRCDGLLAAEKYIIEREQKRVKGFDIPKHALYTANRNQSVEYAGIRHIDGQSLALLKYDDEIRVLPVDDATMRHLKRIHLGQQITVNAKGAIKVKGRSR